MVVQFKDVSESVSILQINRPRVRNALDWDAMEMFAAAVEQAHARAGLRALILTGAGEAFIAGGDLRALHTTPGEADGWRLTRLMTRALNRLEALPCPVIAALNGPARGGGAEIALACDLRVVDENADLSFAQITLGLTPGWGGGQRLLRLVGYSRALEWLVTGQVLTPSEMLTSGLVNRVAPAGQALAAARELAERIAQHAPEAVGALKRLLRGGLELPPALAAAQEQSLFPSLWASPFHHQAVARWLERRKSDA